MKNNLKNIIQNELQYLYLSSWRVASVVIYRSLSYFMLIPKTRTSQLISNFRVHLMKNEAFYNKKNKTNMNINGYANI